VRRNAAWLWVGAALAVPACPQRLHVVSEFQRVGLDGDVISEDRTAHPREMISPAVARNAFASLRIVVAPLEGAPFRLFIAQNPDNTVVPKVYREASVRSGDTSIPDRLTLADQPVTNTLAASQRVQTYLLDLWVPAEAEPGRMRLEIQLNCGDEWTIYPLEIRIMQSMTPRLEQDLRDGQLPPVSSRADAAARDIYAGYLCGAQPSHLRASSELTLREVIRRNAMQDVALARVREKTDGKAGVAELLLRASGFEQRDPFCAVAPSLAPSGAEWVLKARDYLIQGRPVR
jgi:hypothetical protein